MARFEFPVLLLFATLGMMMMISANDLITLYVGLELQSLALYVVAAFQRDSRALDRGRPQVFRPRRALLGHAALRRLAGLRLRRHHQLRCASPAVRRHRRRRSRSGSSSASSSSSPASPSRSRPCRSTCGRPTSTRARRRRSPPSSPSRPRSPPSASSCGSWSGRSASCIGEWQQIIIFISIASMVLGAFAAIGQTNIKRLMAYSSIGNVGYALIGLAAGTPQGIRGVLIYLAIYLFMTARHLRLHPAACARRAAWSRASPISPASRKTNPMMALALGDLHVLAGRHPAARRLLRQVLCVHAADRRRGSIGSP